MPSRLKWKRVYAGRYEASCKTVIVNTHGTEETVKATAIVRHMPDWNGPDKWAVEVEGWNGDYRMNLVGLTDIIARSKREAVEEAEESVATGYKFVSHLGYCSRRNS